MERLAILVSSPSKDVVLAPWSTFAHSTDVVSPQVSRFLRQSFTYRVNGVPAIIAADAAAQLGCDEAEACGVPNLANCCPLSDLCDNQMFDAARELISTILYSDMTGDEVPH